MSAIETALTEFIRKELLEDPDYDLQASDELLLDGLVDSMGVMRLVDFIEAHTGLSIPTEDVIIDNFASVEAIVRYVGRRAGGD